MILSLILVVTVVIILLNTNFTNNNIETFQNVYNPVQNNSINPILLPKNLNYKKISDYSGPATIAQRTLIVDSLNTFFDLLIRWWTNPDKLPDILNKKVTIYEKCGTKINNVSKFPENETPFYFGIGNYLLNNVSPKISKIGAIQIPYGLKVTLYNTCNNKEGGQGFKTFTESEVCYNSNDGITGSSKITYDISSLTVQLIDTPQKKIIDDRDITAVYIYLFGVSPTSSVSRFNRYFNLLFDDKTKRLKDYNDEVINKINSLNSAIDNQICAELVTYKYNKQQLNISQTNLQNTINWRASNATSNLYGWNHSGAWYWVDNQNCSPGWHVSNDNFGKYWVCNRWCSFFGCCAGSGQWIGTYRKNCNDYTNDWKNSGTNLNTFTSNVNSWRTEVQNSINRLNALEAQKITFPTPVDDLKVESGVSKQQVFEREQKKVFLSQYASMFPSDGIRRATILNKIITNQYNDSDTWLKNILDDWNNPNLQMISLVDPNTNI